MLLVNGSRPKITGLKILKPGSRMKMADVGGKFSRQSEMIRAGIHVPPFFCLTAAFYETVFASLAPAVSRILKQANLGRQEELIGAAAHIRKMFVDVQLSRMDE